MSNKLTYELIHFATRMNLHKNKTFVSRVQAIDQNIFPEVLGKTKVQSKG
jgi:hypothetical protein